MTNHFKVLNECYIENGTTNAISGGKESQHHKHLK